MTAHAPVEKKVKEGTCSIVSCDKPALPKKSWCAEHYQLFRELGRIPAEPAEPSHTPGYLKPFLNRPPEVEPLARPHDVETCEKPGCTRPRYSTDKRHYRYCHEHLWPQRGESKAASKPEQRRGKQATKPTPRELPPPIPPVPAQPAPQIAAGTYPSLRRCGGCGQTLTIDHFDTAKDSRFGILNFTCRACEAR